MRKNVNYIIIGLGLGLICLSMVISTSNLPSFIYVSLSLFTLILSIAVFFYEKSSASIRENKEKKQFTLSDFLFLFSAPLSMFMGLMIGGLFDDKSISILNNAISLMSVGFLLLTIALKTKE